MGEASSADGLFRPTAMTSFEATPAATSAPVRTKSRRETVPIGVLDMRRPALLVLAPPHLHGLRVAQDHPAFRVEVQYALNLPRDVGKLQHGHRDVAISYRGVEFLA